MGKTIAQLGFKYSSVDSSQFGKGLLIMLIEVIVFSHLSCIAHIGFESCVLGYFGQDFGFCSVGTV